MPTLLVCARDTLAQKLGETPLSRAGLDTTTVHTTTEALSKAGMLRPRLVMVDRDLHQAEFLVRQLRAGEATRAASIVVIADGDSWSEELGLIDAGANAVLHLPPGPEWDARIEALLNVPTRRETRLTAELRLLGERGDDRIRARVTNLSSTGLLLDTAMALAVGAEFTFRLELPGFETSSGEVAGALRIVRMAGPGRYGAQFGTLDPVGRELLRRYLEQR